jgi:hypothetical protein
MLHPSDHQVRFEAIRDGRAAPVTCAACGCRLERVGFVNQAAWFHFSPMDGRDARGCRVDCAELAHDGSGRS